MPSNGSFQNKYPFLSVWDGFLCVAEKAGLHFSWERRDEKVVLMLFMKNDKERRRLKRAMEEFLPSIEKIFFRKFLEGKYDNGNAPHVPNGAKTMSVDNNGDLTFRL
jgi:hypothetical protein